MWDGQNNQRALSLLHLNVADLHKIDLGNENKLKMIYRYSSEYFPPPPSSMIALYCYLKWFICPQIGICSPAMPRITEVSKWNRFKYHLVIVQRLARCNYMLQRTSGTAAAEQPSSFNNKLSLPLLKSFFAHDKKSWLDIVWG